MQPSSCLLILFTSLVSSVLLAGTGRKSTVAKEEGDSVVGVTVATPASASSKMSPTISISNTLPEGGNKAEQGVMEEEEFIPVICLRHASPANAINDVQSPTRRRRCLTEMSPQQLEEALIRLHLEAGKNTPEKQALVASPSSSSNRRSRQSTTTTIITFAKHN